MKKSFAALAAAAMLATTVPAMADLTVPNLSYRTGSYAANGIPYADGFADYFTLLNERDGGIGGEKVAVPECETAYNTEKGVECYESTKGQAALAYNPLSTGITYQLIPKVTADHHVLYTPGYGRTSSANGSVFEWVFNYPANYWDGASVAVKYMLSQNGDDLKGKKVALVYHNSAYGKEPIRTLEELAKKHGFELVTIAVDPPGQEQKSQWLQIRREKPDYVLMWGWGVMNQVALQAAQKVGFPREKMIGSWWAGSEEDTVPAGEAAKGYMSATWNVAGKDVPLVADIEKVVYGAGKGNLSDKSKLGSILYNRGVSYGILAVEAIRKAQEKYGKGKTMSGEQIAWAMENLDLNDAKLKALGATGLLPPIKTSCEDHEGSGKVKLQQWDGSKWVVKTDWIDGNRQLVHPLFKASAAQFAKDKGITPRDCKKAM